MVTTQLSAIEKRALRAAKKIQANRHKNHTVRSMLAIAWRTGHAAAQADVTRATRPNAKR